MALNQNDLKEIKQIVDDSVEQLAVMVAKGFESVEKRLEGVEKRLT